MYHNTFVTTRHIGYFNKRLWQKKIEWDDKRKPVPEFSFQNRIISALGNKELLSIMPRIRGQRLRDRWKISQYQAPIC